MGVYKQLPMLLAGMAHPNLVVARRLAQTCLDRFLARAYGSDHPESKHVLDELRRDVVAFISTGIVTPELKQRLGRYRVLMTNETTLEALHALTHRLYQNARNAGSNHISLVTHLPEMKRALEDGKLSMETLASHCDKARTPTTALQLLGAERHPAIQQILSGSSESVGSFRSPLNRYPAVTTVVHVIYHRDILSTHTAVQVFRPQEPRACRVIEPHFSATDNVWGEKLKKIWVDHVLDVLEGSSDIRLMLDASSMAAKFLFTWDDTFSAGPEAEDDFDFEFEECPVAVPDSRAGSERLGRNVQSLQQSQPQLEPGSFIGLSVVYLNPGRLKLSQHAVATLSAKSVVVGIHSVLQGHPVACPAWGYCSVGSELGSAKMFVPSALTADMISSAKVAHVKDKVAAMLKPELVAGMHADLVLECNTLLTQFVDAGATHGEQFFVLARSSHHYYSALQRLRDLGVVVCCDDTQDISSSKWQLTSFARDAMIDMVTLSSPHPVLDPRPDVALLDSNVHELMTQLNAQGFKIILTSETPKALQKHDPYCPGSDSTSLTSSKVVYVHPYKDLSRSYLLALLLSKVPVRHGLAAGMYADMYANKSNAKSDFTFVSNIAAKKPTRGKAKARPKTKVSTGKKRVRVKPVHVALNDPKSFKPGKSRRKASRGHNRDLQPGSLKRVRLMKKTRVTFEKTKKPTKKPPLRKRAVASAPIMSDDDQPLVPKRSRGARAKAATGEVAGDWKRFAIEHYGEIIFEERHGKLNAACAKHRCEKCKADRLSYGSIKPGRSGQGRPIGLLVAWLLEGDSCLTKKDHGKDCKAWLSSIDGFEARVFACAFAKTIPAMAKVFECERPKRDDEDSEPETVPF